MHILVLFVKDTVFCNKCKLRQQRKTTASTNHKRRHLLRRCSHGISQNILTQILDVIQLAVALYLQVYDQDSLLVKRRNDNHSP